MESSTLFLVLFNLVIFALLLFDLFFFHRKNKNVEISEALWLSAF